MTKTRTSAILEETGRGSVKPDKLGACGKTKILPFFVIT